MIALDCAPEVEPQESSGESMPHHPHYNNWNGYAPYYNSGYNGGYHGRGNKAGYNSYMGW